MQRPCLRAEIDSRAQGALEIGLKGAARFDRISLEQDLPVGGTSNEPLILH
jgi:hypothetical protein